MGKKVVLVITDGIGHNTSCKDNAFCNAKKPTYDFLFKNAANSFLKTSGLAVGLPHGQMGNSEVGHMSIGSGRVIYQNLVKISKAIENGSLEKNETLQKNLDKSNDVHIVGLLSDGGVHSHIEHIKGVIEIASKANKKVFIHAITDGRDVAFDSAIHYVKELLEFLNSYPNASLATIGGRFYTMDRDNRWERVSKGYVPIAFGKTNNEQLIINNALDYIEQQYKEDVFDEFLEPVALEGYDGLKDNDLVVFANFRNDRMREIAQAIGSEGFKEFKTKDVKVNVLTMTQYDKSFPFDALFPPEDIQNTLAQVISNAGLKQLHTAETEKYAHVTFFLNGGVEEPVLNESRVLIPSPKIATYDLQPAMSAPQVGKIVLKAMDEKYDFIVVNFANGDMVGHTGNYEAGVKAVQAVDKELGNILDKAKDQDYSVLITSDHGNCEQMKDENGNTLTNHTTFEVFCFLVDKNIKKINNGALCNIAPTVLELMGLEVPKQMNESLLSE